MLFLLVFTSQTPTRKYSVAYCATHTVERQCRALSSKAALPHALNTAAMPRNVERSSMPHYVLHDTLYNVCMPQNRNARNTVERQCRTIYVLHDYVLRHCRCGTAAMFCGTAAMFCGTAAMYCGTSRHFFLKRTTWRHPIQRCRSA